MMNKNKSEFEGAISESGNKSEEDWIIAIGFLIHDCSRLRRIVLDEKYKPLNITRSQAWLLAYLSRSEGLAQSALAEQMALGKVAVGGLIDRLENGGLIERRSDASDRRVNSIYLTPKGHDVARQMRKLTLEANEDILAGITLEEAKTGVSVLDQLRSNIQKLKKRELPD